jgi:uncharacterized circularly permuted ATP-grasp superfamily protein/uncharacterized alpha-E superfamily protein
MSNLAVPTTPSVLPVGPTTGAAGVAGIPRQSWLASLERLEREELDARAENCRRLLNEHGVSCFVQRDGTGTDQPWQLDILPLVLGADEWRTLEAGLIQRARLLNLMLGDLYSRQRLVRDGFVPAQLIFANPAYLRACQAIQVKGNVFLQTYAADLGRSADGRWCVLADRTQAPAGVGFAMENRSVLARVLPEAMHELQPRPLLDSLRLRRETLRHFAPDGVDNPSLVLLTPGPRHEVYFEHAYLSRLLGLTLVEGDDLTVRNRRLFVKTLNGLRQVDVVLRRVNDTYCDPLELRADSLLGVPGLVEAARAGHICLGNALGSGLLESPAFLPFMPGVCRQLLDEDLAIPSLATWWCGEAAEQRHVCEHLDELAIRPGFNLVGPALLPSEMHSVQRSDLLEQLRLRPHDFIGQAPLDLAHVPVWTPGGESSAPFILRVFVLHNGTDFTVMPGGLVRLLEAGRIGSGALSLSGPSKDVWIPAEAAVPGGQAAVLTSPLPGLEASSADLPSRTADNFFWLGRYAERLEQLVRATRQVLGCLEQPTGLSQQRLVPLRQALARLAPIPKLSQTGNSGASLQSAIHSLVWDPAHSGGVQDLLRRIHLAAFSVRDRLSADIWRLLNRLQRDGMQPPGGNQAARTSELLHQCVLDLAAFSGMEMENMTRGQGWAFLDFGRRIERALGIAGLLTGVWQAGLDSSLLLEPALEIADSVMTHRRRYFFEPQPASVLEVLVMDAANPRSLAFQLAALRQHAAALPIGLNPAGVQGVQQLVGRIEAQMGRLQESQNPETAADVDGTATALADFTARLTQLSERITEIFFDHVSPRGGPT